jgi:hypothetical protein
MATIVSMKETGRTGVFLCLISGSAWNRSESKTSNSMQRQPVNKTCLYISTLEVPCVCQPSQRTNEQRIDDIRWTSVVATCEIRVVRRCNEIMRQRLIHVHEHVVIFQFDDEILVAEQIMKEGVSAHV